MECADNSVYIDDSVCRQYSSLPLIISSIKLLSRVFQLLSGTMALTYHEIVKINRRCPDGGLKPLARETIYG